jgi:hypothetical protein
MIAFAKIISENLIAWNRKLLNSCVHLFSLANMVLIKEMTQIIQLIIDRKKALNYFLIYLRFKLNVLKQLIRF